MQKRVYFNVFGLLTFKKNKYIKSLLFLAMVLLALPIVFADERLFNLGTCSLNTTQITEETGSLSFSDDGAGNCAMFVDDSIDANLNIAMFNDFDSETIYINITWDADAGANICSNVIVMQDFTGDRIMVIMDSGHAVCGNIAGSLSFTDSANPDGTSIVHRESDGFVTQKWQYNRSTKNISVWNEDGSFNFSKLSDVTTGNPLNSTKFGEDGDGTNPFNITKFEVWNVSTPLVIESDSTNPVIQIGTNITAPKVNDHINITFNVTDDTAPTFVNLTINYTGDKQISNYTTTTNVNLTNITIISATRGNVLNFSVCAIDAEDNYACNSTKVTIADSIGTMVLGQNLSEIKVGDVINISGNITENDGDIAFGLVGHNQSGPMVNTSFEGSGSNFNFSQSITITQTRDEVINFTVWYNDTSGTLAQSSLKLTVANTVPILSSIVGGAKELEPFNSSLKLYLDMDERNSTDVFDRTTNNNDGDIKGANKTDGKLGWGMKFDGADDFINIDTALTNSLATTTVGTWEAWIKPVDATPAGFERIVAFSDASANAVLDLFVSTSGILRMVARNSVELKWDLDTDNAVFSDNVWTYIAITQDGTEPVLYIDGVAVAQAFSTTTDKTWWFSDDGNLDNGRIGDFNKNGAGEANHFNGVIDEVKIWDVALDNDTIVRHYSQGRGIGNITTQTPLAVAVNSSSDADNDVLFTAMDWWKGTELNATTGRPDDDNVSLWMIFDQRNITGSIEDYSTHNNSGEIVGAKFTNDSAMGLGAFEFDGVDDYVKLGNNIFDSLVAGGNGNNTISFWIKTDTTTNSMPLSIEGGWFFRVNNVANKVGITYTGGSGDMIDSSTDVNDNQWHHIASSYNGTTAVLYFDGVEENTATQTLSNLGANRATAIGSQHDGSANFNGIIDEVRIWNATLTSTEINKHYLAGVRKGLTLNQSQTKKNENWNVTVTLYDSAPSASTSINFSFDTIGNTIPTIGTFSNSSEKTFNTNVTFNWTACTDPDATDGIDTITYDVYFDKTNPPTAQMHNDITVLNITTNMTDEGTYFLNRTCTDGTETLYFSIINLTLDISTPTLLGVPANGTFYRENTLVTVTATDNIQLFETNATVYNMGTSVIRNSTNTTNISATTFLQNITILTAWGDSLFNATWWAGDTKNKKRPMPQYKVGVSLDNRTLQFNNTNTGLECNITYGTTNPAQKKFLPVQANVSLKMSVTYVDDDYYKIVYDVVAPNTGFISATKFQCNQQIIQIDDNLAGHLLIGTGKDRLSYDAQDLVDSGFTVETKIDDFDNTFFQVIKKSGIVEGEVISYDPRADNLNIIEESITFEIDTGIPEFFDLNLSTTKMHLNNTFISATILNFTNNQSDKNNDSVLWYVNGVKNITTGYISNKTSNATIIITDDGNYTILREINDSAGNKINSSFINVVVDTTVPTFTGIFNRSVPDNTTNIKATNNVNLSIHGLGDIYLSALNISENANGSNVNHSITIKGNDTYFYIIGAGNLSANENVSGAFYAYDLAGNLLSQSYSFIVDPLPTTTSTPSGDESSDTATGGLDDVTQKKIVTKPSTELDPTEPINVFIPTEWLTEKETEVKLFFFQNETLYDPKIISFEFKPADYFIYRNLTKNAKGNYTAIFFTKSFARIENPDETKTVYTMVVKAKSSPEITKEITFTLKKSGIIQAITDFAKERGEDTVKVFQKVTGSNKEGLTSWQKTEVIGA